MLRIFFRTFFLSILASLFISCSGTIGWGVVMWNIPEKKIADGTVVPVYLKSNIEHIYVIGVPYSDEKIEVPLWQISEPTSKSKAVKLSQKYREYEKQYARCALDGLPIREASVNTSKQIYRLRKDEIIRLLFDGEGTAPTTGSQALEGKWISVLTHDGHTGWCFSHNLRQFTMNDDGSFGAGAEEAQVKETDTALEAMLSSEWYPDYYNRMITSREINLDEMQASFKFDPGVQSGTVHIGWPGLSASYPFHGITKTENSTYKFDETPVQVTLRSGKLITVQYTDKKGKPRSYNYITLPPDKDINQIIADEIEERNARFRNLKTLGPDYRSSGYGTLTFSDTSSFSWTNFNELVPSVISTSAKNTGTVSFKYFVPKTLRARFDGIITFKFDGQEKEVNFFYKSENNGLRFTLANVTKTMNEITNTDSATVTLAVNPEVIYFSR